ncbi:hypothetical protein NADFUDRAFT_73687 [Nadsonia fulvescens var. elongata DSM 6958]|uniref:Heat shock transcription factor n=1 Tax=Nadsonia fulvescens var. elongata DSM 6958 TaxID=857566 RepID=A0A1E3PMQ6_9ASCO|nr:hypothetical protein NADFUDRAFT_73687 [Nadsonia fulvescens var. elongata DSM 6958]
MTPNVFVQKLFTMLQTPDVQNSVRWSPTGDSFQIIDTNAFTSTVLPKHFNNGNFASFVRQLNKYDFHKIKTSVPTEGKGGSTDVNPNSIWEFKHPDFQLHKMELLENIKRKVPAQRKKLGNKDCCSSSQDQLMEVEQELHTLKENYSEVCTRLDEVMLNYKWAIENITGLIESNKERDNTIKYLLRMCPNNGMFRVLLVEDDDACINVCRQILILYGCEVDVVTDGLSAVDMMKRNDSATNPNSQPYNLILMDIIMPNLDGVSASGLIREFNKVTPIIAMPANNIGQNDITNYMHNGMNDVLTKPFNKASLYAVLDKYLKS